MKVESPRMRDRRFSAWKVFWMVVVVAVGIGFAGLQTRAMSLGETRDSVTALLSEVKESAALTEDTFLGHADRDDLYGKRYTATVSVPTGGWWSAYTKSVRAALGFVHRTIANSIRDAVHISRDVSRIYVHGAKVTLFSFGESRELVDSFRIATGDSVVRSLGAAMEGVESGGVETITFFGRLREKMRGWFGMEGEAQTVILPPPTPAPETIVEPQIIERTNTIERIIETRNVSTQVLSQTLTEADLAQAITDLRNELLPRIKAAALSPRRSSSSSSGSSVSGDYLELAGGTLTGALFGTDATFSGDLSVVGTFADSSGDIGTSGYVLQSTATGTDWVATSTLGISGGSSQWTTAGNDIYYTTGSVGIGTTSIPAALTVNGLSGAAAANQAIDAHQIWVGPQNPNDPGGYLEIPTWNSANVFVTEKASSTQGTNGLTNILNLTESGAGATGFSSYITDYRLSGSVVDLIGLESAVYFEGLGDTTNITGIHSYLNKNNAGTVSNFYGVYTNADYHAGGLTNSYGLYIADDSIDASSSVGVWLDTNDSGDGNDHAIYAAGTAPSYFAGNIGIGTTTPGAALHVHGGDILANGDFSMLSSDGLSSFSLRTFGATDGETPSKFLVRDTTGGTVLSIVDGTGNVGVGTTSPYARLAVVPSATGTDAFVIANPENWIFTNTLRVKPFSTNTTSGGVDLTFGSNSCAGNCGDTAILRTQLNTIAQNQPPYFEFLNGNGSVVELRASALQNGNPGGQSLRLDQAGLFLSAADSAIGFSSVGSAAGSGSDDVGISRQATGILRVTDGGAGGGALWADSFYATSTTATSTFSGVLYVAGTLADSTGNRGTSGMVLKSTGTGLAWVATSTLGISGGSSQWTTSGSNIYYTSGNVGIGESTPTEATLYLVGTSGTTTAWTMPALKVIGGSGAEAASAGAGGVIQITAGAGGNASGFEDTTGGTGGDLTMAAGDGGSAQDLEGNAYSETGGLGGSVLISGGTGGYPNGSGWTGVQGAGGSVTIQSGSGSTGGNINLTAQSSGYILHTGGRFGFGTSTPFKTFSTVGTVAMSGLTAASGSSPSALCLTSQKEVVVNTGSQTCTVSSLRFKHNVESLETGLSTINRLSPSVFVYNDSNEERIGLIAEEVEKVDSRLIFREDDGRPRGVRYEDIVAVLVRAIQELDVKVERSLAAVGVTVEDGVARFVEIVTGKVTTTELCLEEVCITKEELQGILDATGIEKVEEAPQTEPATETEEPPAEETPGEEPPSGEPSNEDSQSEEVSPGELPPEEPVPSKETEPEISSEPSIEAPVE